MRRMLDPTKIGGGGAGSNLYLHCVKLTDVSPETIIAVNFVTKSNEKVNTIDLLKKYLLTASGVVCNGYTKVGDHFAIFNRIDTIGTSLVAYYIDLTTGRKDTYYLTNADSIADTPMPVK